MEMEKLILGLDQSTSGTKVIGVNANGKILYKASKEHKQYYPLPGYVEHDMDEVFDNCVELIQNAMKHLSYDYEIVGLSITNQRETIIFWDKATGKPLIHALVWQDRRGSEICERLTNQGYDKVVSDKTGLKLDPYFSASKILWTMENEEKVKSAAKEGTLAIGTVDTYLIYRLTGGKVFATDDTNASRTLLYNITNQGWDEELMTLFDVRKGALAEIRSSNDFYGYIAKEILGSNLPIAGVIGDSQGALFGQQCFDVGRGKVTYGTGSSILLYMGEKQVKSEKGIVTSVAWSYDGKVEYAIEGMINSSGDTLKWVKDNLGLYQDDKEVEALIASLDSNEGVYIVPAFQGLGAPYWSSEARAAIVGMTRRTGKAHIVRAAVESMAYQVADLIGLMEEETGTRLSALSVDGGPTNNPFLMQIQSNLLKTAIECGENQELSAMGAIYLGGLRLGLWKDRQVLKDLKEIKKVYMPEKNDNHQELLKEWHEAVGQVLTGKH